MLWRVLWAGNPVFAGKVAGRASVLAAGVVGCERGTVSATRRRAESPRGDLSAHGEPKADTPAPAAIEVLLTDYERHLQLERNRSPHTVRAYLGDVAAALDFAADRGHAPDQIELGDLRAWLGAHAAGLSSLQPRATRGVGADLLPVGGRHRPAAARSRGQAGKPAAAAHPPDGAARRRCRAGRCAR